MTKRAYSPREILARKFKTLPWSGAWEKAFGQPEDNSMWLIHGPSAAGKSSFVMQLSKELCSYGTVLYLSLEEGVGQSFQQRIGRFRMREVQGRFRISTDDSIERLTERLTRAKSPKFIVVDSVQKAEWQYPEVAALVDRFRRKCFIFISQEEKGQPMGKTAKRLKYLAGVKVRVAGYKAYCQGRFMPEAGAYYPVWEEGIMKTTNNLE